MVQQFLRQRPVNPLHHTVLSGAAHAGPYNLDAHVGYLLPFVVFATEVFLGEIVFCWRAAAFFVPCMSNRVIDFPVFMKISALEKAVQAQ